MPRGEETRPVTMRLPVSLVRQLKLAAQEEDRSVTNLVTVILRGWLDERERDGA